MVTTRQDGSGQLPELFPSYWFHRLEQALSDGDFHQAAEAARQLRQFGIVIRYPRPLFEAPADTASPGLI